MTIKAVFAGSFDPLTNGHIDLIKRSLTFCDQLIVGIGINPSKKVLFTEVERADLIRSTFAHYANVKVNIFQGLLVDYAAEIKASVLVRGIRSVSDFEYEINLAGVNKVLAPQIETVFLPTSSDLAIVSSSMVKELAKYGRDVSKFVPEHIAEALLEKLKNTPK